MAETPTTGGLAGQASQVTEAHPLAAPPAGDSSDGFGPVRLEQGGHAPAPSGQGTAAKVPPSRTRGPRRAKLQLRHVTPWTVFRFACVLSVSLFVVWMIVIALLYGVLDAAGVVGDINRSVTTINGPGSSGVITPGRVFLYSLLIGVVNSVLFIALATVGSYVYNLCADLVGGIEVTLSEREI